MRRHIQLSLAAAACLLVAACGSLYGGRAQPPDVVNVLYDRLPEPDVRQETRVDAGPFLSNFKSYRLPRLRRISAPATMSGKQPESAAIWVLAPGGSPVSADISVQPAPRENADELPPMLQELSSDEIKMWKAYYAAKTAEYETDIKMQAYNRDVFAWQLKASGKILWLVLTVTGAGVLFSAYELYTSHRLVHNHVYRRRAVHNDVQADESSMRAEVSPATPMQVEDDKVIKTNSITLTPTSLQISSAIIGIVVLALSLGFLYLFLDKVYEIKSVSTESVTAERRASAPDMPISGSAASYRE